MLYVHAKYDDVRTADDAVRALLNLHMSPRDLRVVVPGGAKPERVPLTHVTGLASNAAAGGLIGLLAGAAVVGAGILGINPADAVTLAGSGALIGGGVGVLGGALRGLGRLQVRPQYESQSAALRSVSVGVLTSPSHLEEVRGTLEATGGEEIRATKPTPQILSATTEA